MVHGKMVLKKIALRGDFFCIKVLKLTNFTQLVNYSPHICAKSCNFALDFGE